MFNSTISPILVSFGQLEIRWYGLMYVLAFIIAYFMIPKLSKHFGVEISKEDTSDFLLYVIILMVICSRLMIVLFYSPEYYFSNPEEIIKIWKGGLSFHGGLIGVFIAGIIFSRKKKIPLLKLADICVIPASIGLFLGRIGNFINGELVGRVTSVPWCVNFKGYEGCRHPSQIYEALKNLILFFTLFHFRDKHKPDGFLFFLFLIMYAVMRSIIEQFFREPQRYILGMTEGQFLNLFMLIIGIYGMAYIYDIKNKKSEKI